MSIEVEIKAWVDSYENVKKELLEHYVFIKEYKKNDLYLRGLNSITMEEKEIRIRKVEDNSIVTYKERSHRDKVEVNIEKEFNVDDYDNFLYILKAIGFQPYIKKEKIGYLFKKEDINIELSHVTGLGDFIEIEAILNDDSDINKATKAIYSILDNLKISRDRVEDKFYVQMLIDKKNKSN